MVRVGYTENHYTASWPADFEGEIDKVRGTCPAFKKRYSEVLTCFGFSVHMDADGGLADVLYNPIKK